MSSFFIVLTADQKAYNGTLHQTFDRPYRLSGEWEMALTCIKYQKSEQCFVFCDLVDYSHVANEKMQFLDFVDSRMTRNNYPRYVKVIRKRFNSINITIREKLLDVSPHLSDSDVTCVLHFRKA